MTVPTKSRLITEPGSPPMAAAIAYSMQPISLYHGDYRLSSIQAIR